VPVNRQWSLCRETSDMAGFRINDATRRARIHTPERRGARLVCSLMNFCKESWGQIDLLNISIF
jgi:hypothetical protein